LQKELSSNRQEGWSLNGIWCFGASRKLTFSNFVGVCQLTSSSQQKGSFVRRSFLPAPTMLVGDKWEVHVLVDGVKIEEYVQGDQVPLSCPIPVTQSDLAGEYCVLGGRKKG